MAEASLLDHPWITRWKLDVHAYHRLGEAGILGADDRVELIEGEVVAMSSIGAAHIGAVMALTRLLVLAVGDCAHVSPQGSIRLQQHSEPQPDIALLRPRADQYRSELPTPADILATGRGRRQQPALRPLGEAAALCPARHPGGLDRRPPRRGRRGACRAARRRLCQHDTRRARRDDRAAARPGPAGGRHPGLSEGGLGEGKLFPP